MEVFSLTKISSFNQYSMSLNFVTVKLIVIKATIIAIIVIIVPLVINKPFVTLIIIILELNLN
jgi:hypothetical protein